MKDVPPYRDEIVIAFGLLIFVMIAAPVVEEFTLPSFRLLHTMTGTVLPVAMVVWLMRRRVRQLKGRRDRAE